MQDAGSALRHCRLERSFPVTRVQLVLSDLPRYNWSRLLKPKAYRSGATAITFKMVDLDLVSVQLLNPRCGVPCTLKATTIGSHAEIVIAYANEEWLHAKGIRAHNDAVLAKVKYCNCKFSFEVARKVFAPFGIGLKDALAI